MKVVICIPAYGDTKAKFTESLGKMLIWTLAQEITYNGVKTRPDLQLLMAQGSSRIDLAREQLAISAIEQNPHYLLWLDADQTFPRDTLVRLAMHDLPFVGCNYPRRGVAGNTASNIVDGTTVNIEPKPEGVEAVDVIGLGVCLMKAGMFEALPRPWFSMVARGEDYFFCEKARNGGFGPHVDHALSKEVGHITQTVLSL